MRPSVILLLAQAAVLLGGCRGLDRAAHDLRALHAPDGAIRYQARTAGKLSFTLGRMGRVPRRGLEAWTVRAAFPEESGLGDLIYHPYADPREATVERPQKRAFERVRRLGEGDGQGSPRVAGTQVELSAFLALKSRSKLVRERAVRILGQAARRLEVEFVAQSVPDPAGPEAVRAAVEQLAAAVGGFEAEGDLERLRSEVARVAELRLALEDWRRVLRVTTGLYESLGRRRWREAGFDGLHRGAQANSVSLALGQALRDPSTWVAAAATEEILTFDRSRLFELYSDASELGLWPTAAACVASIADRGLPEEGPLLDVWLERLVVSAQVNDAESIEDDRLRLLSAQALGRVSGAGFESLRWEDWVRWYWRYSDRILGDTFATEGPESEGEVGR